VDCGCGRPVGGWLVAGGLVAGWRGGGGWRWRLAIGNWQLAVGGLAVYEGVFSMCDAHPAELFLSIDVYPGDAESRRSGLIRPYGEVAGSPQ